MRPVLPSHPLAAPSRRLRPALRVAGPPRPDGSWEHYVYDHLGRPTNVFAALGTQGPTNHPSLCRLTVHDYSSNTVAAWGDAGLCAPSQPRKSTESLQGQPVAVKYHAYLQDRTVDIQCLDAGASSTNVASVTTVTTRYTSGRFYGQPQSITHPDGTMEFFEYSEGGKREGVGSDN